MAKDTSKLKGVAVDNGKVAAFHRKHGAPVFSKPHGESKTILYYPNTDADAGADEVEPIEHYEGKTPGRRDRVVHKGVSGSKIQGRTLSAATSPRTEMGAESLGDLSAEAEKAEVVNEGDLDDEILEIEEDVRRQAGEDEDGEEKDDIRPASERVKGVEQEPSGTNPDDIELNENKNEEDNGE